MRSGSQSFQQCEHTDGVTSSQPSPLLLCRGMGLAVSPSMAPGLPMRISSESTLAQASYQW